MAAAPPAPPVEARLRVEFVEMSEDARALLQREFGLAALPLRPARLTLELGGVPTALANGIRRVLLDELPGRCLRVPADGLVRLGDAEQEVHCTSQLLSRNIAHLALRPHIPPETAADLEFELDVSNIFGGAETPGTGLVPRQVFANDLNPVKGVLEEPIFNPVAQIGFVMPGRRLVVRGIRLASGIGRVDAAFKTVCRAAAVPLDIPTAPREATHLPGGTHADLSGYLTPSAMADPRRHRITALLRAVGPRPEEARGVLVDALRALADRLSAVRLAVLPGAPPPEGNNMFVEADLGGGLWEGELLVPGETETVGEIIRRAAFDLGDGKGLTFIGCQIVSHMGHMRLTLRHASPPGALLAAAADLALGQVREILRQI